MIRRNKPKGHIEREEIRRTEAFKLLAVYKVHRSIEKRQEDFSDKKARQANGRIISKYLKALTFVLIEERDKREKELSVECDF